MYVLRPLAKRPYLFVYESNFVNGARSHSTRPTSKALFCFSRNFVTRCIPQDHRRRRKQQQPRGGGGGGHVRLVRDQRRDVFQQSKGGTASAATETGASGKASKHRNQAHHRKETRATAGGTMTINKSLHPISNSFICVFQPPIPPRKPPRRIAPSSADTGTDSCQV